MKFRLIIIFLFLSLFIYSQQNEFFIELSQRELATFNDGITLMKLLYNERDYDSTFIDNILWAADKKLFQVSIPIKKDEVNPVLTRRELAYWICKIFNMKGGLVNKKTVIRYTAFRICVRLGILEKGRGGFDSMTGPELLDTFAYLDYFIRNNNITPKQGELEIYDDTYKSMPQWRINLYRELEEQKAKEKELRIKKRKARQEKRLERRKQEKERNNIQEKVIEQKIEE